MAAVTFYDGNRMPVVGLGTWQSPKHEVKSAVSAALEAGYRHIDTAYNYLNEDAIGEVLYEWISSGKIKRSQLFIVTKLPMIGNRAEDVEKFLRKSLAKLKLDYVDLYLVHSPVGMIGKHDEDVFPMDEQGNFVVDMNTDLVGLWKAMEGMVDKGLAKSIGLSNFSCEQIERIVNNSRIKPANVQVEMHAQFQQKKIRKLCERYGITVCAYAPLGSPGRTNFIPGRAASVLDEPVVVSLARKHKKTPAQVLLCYLVQLGVAVIPKSVNQERIVENIQIFTFYLSDEEMKLMDDLDRGSEGRYFTMESFMKGIHHPEYQLDD